METFLSGITKLPPYILGLSISHDATAVVLNAQGQVLAGIGEERLTRYKYHETFPFQSIKWLLDYTGINGSDVTEVAYNWRNIGGSRPYRKNIFSHDKPNVDWANDIPSSIARQISIDWLLRRFRLYKKCFPGLSDLNYVQESLGQCGVITNNITAYDHQLCHASSAFFSSGFEKSLVVSIDGYGDEKSGGIYIGQNNQLRRVEDMSSDASAGSFYANVTGALGFKRNRHEGKVTGLSAFGDASICEHFLREFFDLDENICLSRPVILERNKAREFLDYLNFFFSGKYELTDDYFRVMKNSIETCNFKRQDIAAAAQNILEDVVLRLIDDRMRRYGCQSLAVAGGVFANVKLNQEIANLKSVNSFFVHPNMGDGGGAFGAAVLALVRENASPIPPMSHVYWGPEYTNEEIQSALLESSVHAEWVADIEVEIARLLASGKVIGRFDGRMEYGPRALCNRSILVEATRSEINIDLNKRLGRTEFMPFAPVILREHGSDLFYKFEESINATKFMTMTLKVREEWRDQIRAVVHADNTARPQWVSKSHNPSAYRILSEFHKITGIPALINTSFNRHEEPIVCTPAEAVSAWQQKCVDVLAIGNYLVR